MSRRVILAPRNLPNELTRHGRTKAAELDFEAFWKENMADEGSCLTPDDYEAALAVWMSAYVHFCED